jgi:hypothetical protein
MVIGQAYRQVTAQGSFVYCFPVRTSRTPMLLYPCLGLRRPRLAFRSKRAGLFQEPPRPMRLVPFGAPMGFSVCPFVYVGLYQS